MVVTRHIAPYIVRGLPHYGTAMIFWQTFANNICQKIMTALLNATAPKYAVFLFAYVPDEFHQRLSILIILLAISSIPLLFGWLRLPPAAMAVVPSLYVITQPALGRVCGE